jgi:hypothetical protein
MTPFTVTGFYWGTLDFPSMAGGEGPPPTVQTRFSADGFWWWDGAEWRAAFSQDRLWRWDGQGWVAARPAAAATGSGSGVGLALGLAGGFVVILILVSVLVIVILLVMGNQIANVFSNVVAALG